MIGFTQAVKMFFKRYTDFSGRSARAEYWWVMLFQVIAAFVLMIPIIAALAATEGEFTTPAIIACIPMAIFVLAIIIPGIALVVRRLHDINQTGWIYLGLVVLGMIPLIGSLATIAQIVIACIPGTQGPNKYGDDPYGNNLAATFD